ncbi:hypothetical protein FRC07_013851 [Ceratobasidium sp. 392]|nr:hypothetical protein FRC07_013851 [Ceratobasidium sp. 392]
MPSPSFAKRGNWDEVFLYGYVTTLVPAAGPIALTGYWDCPFEPVQYYSMVVEPTDLHTEADIEYLGGALSVWVHTQHYLYLLAHPAEDEQERWESCRFKKWNWDGQPLGKFTDWEGGDTPPVYWPRDEQHLLRYQRFARPDQPPEDLSSAEPEEEPISNEGT